VSVVPATMTTMAAVVLVTAACAAQLDDGGPWRRAEELTGDLAVECGAAATVATPRDVLRVATWNVHYGADAEGLATELGADPELATADVVLVQEIEAYRAEGRSRARRLAEALGMAWCYAPARTEPGGSHGLAILSRYPLEAAAVRALPRFESSFRQRDRNALWLEVVVGPHRVPVVGVHLDVRLGAVDRIRQLDPATLDLPDRVVLGGDFNTNPWVWAQSTLPLTGTEAITGLEQAQILDDYLAASGFVGDLPPDVATMRLPAFAIRTDNVYTRGYPILRSGVGTAGGSDHWPVWVDLDLVGSRPR
jgi:endonuclease/exonuclease/phosphatase family metal-dependent hydrolase